MIRASKIISHVRAAIDNPGVTIAPYGSSDSEPSAVSSTDAAGYKMLERTIRQVFPETLVVPAQVLGGTDSRHYAGLAEQVYRFRPLRMEPDDVARYHGVDERVSIKNYAAIVHFCSCRKLLSKRHGHE